MKILVVDDEPDVLSLIRTGIEIQRPQHEVVTAANGVEALARVASDRPDAVLLDLVMPGRDGFSVLRELRAEGNDVPVIVITAKGLEEDRVRGLEEGADDYVTKPFSTAELLARLDAVMRRYRATAPVGPAAVLDLGGVRIDTGARSVTVEGKPVSFTPTEYQLLVQLAMSAGRVLSHEALLENVWGREQVSEIHYLKVYVGRVRTKIERDPQRPVRIVTVRGVGYRYDAEVPS